nr:hypothetical protein [bacterium]
MTTLRVVIPGALGRIGQALIRYIHTHEGVELYGATERPDHPDIAKDIGGLVLGRNIDIKLENDLRNAIIAANAIIDALRFRRERLLEVARAVVDAQRDFLDQGEQHLKVLRMSDLAQRFSCDPSTISRTVDEKYLQTPRGIYPLRKFFTGGTEGGDGEAL